MNTQEIKVTNAQTISVNAKLQDKIVTPSLEKQDVLPDENYNGLSKVVVDAVSLENKTVKPNRDTQIITPIEALGLSSVTIEPVSLEEKNIIPSKEVQSLNPSDNFVGFSKLVVEAIPEEYIIPNGNLDIKNNGNYDVKDNATVNVNVQPNLQDKSENIKAPANVFVHPDEGYDGLAFVNVIATVDTEQVIITPTKEEQVLTPSEKTYFDSVTVNAIPDNYIEPSGELEITENGSYDVTDKVTVKVETSGADLNEYFNYRPENISSSSYWFRDNYFKKMPEIIIPDNCTSLSYFCSVGSTDNYVFQIIPKIICGNNVTNLNNMYYRCRASKVDLSGLDTSNVKNMSYMFSYFGSAPLDFSNWDTSNLESMNNMFQWASSIVDLDLSNFKTNKVTTLYSLYYACNALQNINMNNLNFEKVQDVGSMFVGCGKLVNLLFGINLGKGFTQKRENYSSYKLDLSPCKLLSHDSLMSVINGLYDLNLTYDVANGGTLYTQQLVLGTDNIAKLTEEEIAIATNKGWTVS